MCIYIYIFFFCWGGCQALSTKEPHRVRDLPVPGEHDLSRGGTESLRGETRKLVLKATFPVNLRSSSRGKDPGLLVQGRWAVGSIV